MNPFVVIASGLLAFEVFYNTWEFSLVHRLRKDKAKFVAAHSQFGEGSELVAFFLAGMLLFLANFNVVLVGIVVVLSLYHLMGTITSKDKISKMFDSIGQKMSRLIMTMCIIEIILSILVISTVILL